MSYFSKEWFISILFPRCCPVCGRIVMPKGNLICSGCIRQLYFIKGAVCKTCGKEVSSQEEYCFDCIRHKKSFTYGRALFGYNEVARLSLSRIKYGNKREYLDFYGEAMVYYLGNVINQMNGDVLVPIPVHKSRMRQRGFNQAAVLAKVISKQTGIPVCESMLVRKKKTLPQKELSTSLRMKNLSMAFHAGAVPNGVKRVILVDDIYTTGATVNACSRVLKEKGIEHVYFLAICIGIGSHAKED